MCPSSHCKMQLGCERSPALQFKRGTDSQIPQLQPSIDRGEEEEKSINDVYKIRFRLITTIATNERTRVVHCCRIHT